jgi:CRP-like cAMP-binding protein
MVGLAAFLGAEASESQILCQIPGTALRTPAPVIAAAGDERPRLRHLLNRYAQAYLTQVAQGAACNRLHGIEQRCARWLLMTHDRVDRAESFSVKQEFLAVMLGVRCAGVTVAAGALQDAGLIRYRRGGIRVLDRAGLEAASCECYGIVRRRYDRLLP